MAADNDSSTVPPREAGGRLYFAYGSNLHVAQMAKTMSGKCLQGEGSTVWLQVADQPTRRSQRGSVRK